MKTKIPARRKELAAVLPPQSAPLAPRTVPEPWRRLLSDLAREWRVFLAQAPTRGERLSVGSSGADAVSIDTIPAIQKVLAEQLISGVLLVGEDAVLDCVQALHGFAPHLPFYAALGEPGHRRWDECDPGRLEFLLGWCDGVFVADEERRRALAPLLRRLSPGCEVAPKPGGRDWAGFVAKVSREIQERFRGLERGAAARDRAVDWIAFLSEDSRALWDRAVSEWRVCLPDSGGVFLVPEAEAALRRRLKRTVPRSRVLAYRDEEEAVARANEALARLQRRRAMVLKPSARLGEATVERMVAAALNHPLTGAVCGTRADGGTPEDFQLWKTFSHAWLIKHRGSCRVTQKLPPACFLIDREALAQTGGLDPRLGWTLAIHDLALRLRQNGWALFQAEDAVVAHLGETAAAADERRRQAFLAKWSVDPSAVLHGTL